MPTFSWSYYPSECHVMDSSLAVQQQLLEYGKKYVASNYCCYCAAQILLLNVYLLTCIQARSLATAYNCDRWAVISLSQDVAPPKACEFPVVYLNSAWVTPYGCRIALFTLWLHSQLYRLV